MTTADFSDSIARFSKLADELTATGAVAQAQVIQEEVEKMKSMQKEMERRENHVKAREETMKLNEEKIKYLFNAFNFNRRKILEHQAHQEERDMSLYEREERVRQKEIRFNALNDVFNSKNQVMVEKKLGERPNWARLREFYEEAMDEASPYILADPTKSKAFMKEAPEMPPELPELDFSTATASSAQAQSQVHGRSLPAVPRPHRSQGYYAPPTSSPSAQDSCDNGNLYGMSLRRPDESCVKPKKDKLTAANAGMRYYHGRQDRDWEG